MIDTELCKTLEKLSSISFCASRESSFEFTSLIHHLNYDFLKDCYLNLDRNKAVGIDGVSWLEYKQDLGKNLESLVIKLKNKSFNPLPAKRVYIPKGSNELRPLGISTIENKIVESGINRILQSIYEVDFYDFSYGFRPKKNAHQALKVLGDEINFKNVSYIVEADIKGFFDNVSHSLLLDFLSIRVKDSSFLFLINKFLEAGYVDNDLLVETVKGTPQGSILSPMLANIFLHYVLDDWFNQVVKKNVSGYCKLIRYADDFICLVDSKRDSMRILNALMNRFRKFGLELHPNKTRVFSFGRFERENSSLESRRANTFDFLGFTHYCDKTIKGHFKVGRKTSGKKFRMKVKELNLWLKKIRNQFRARDWWKTLILKLRGHYEYYGVSENYHSLRKFYLLAVRLAKKWLNRRSQKRKMNWERMANYLKLFPLPKPSIRHNFYIPLGNL